jgi:aconitate hydratase
LTFANEADYDKIQEDDSINIVGLGSFAPDKSLTIELVHADGITESFAVNHTYNEQQIEWFKAGGALNIIRASVK